VKNFLKSRATRSSCAEKLPEGGLIVLVPTAMEQALKYKEEGNKKFKAGTYSYHLIPFSKPKV
jgi:hypothetical protein